jgi:hypothetical protein
VLNMGFDPFVRVLNRLFGDHSCAACAYNQIWCICFYNTN